MRADVSAFARKAVLALGPVGPFSPRPESRGLVNLRFNENRPTVWDERNLLLTRGAVDALELVLRAFFEPGADAIALTPPTFGFFDRLAALHGVARHRVPLLGPGFQRLDLERLLALPVKGVLLCDPGNPTGTTLHPADVAALLDRFPGLVVIDETYAELAGRPSHRHRVADHPNLVVLRSMSKGFALAGLRLGAIWIARTLRWLPAAAATLPQARELVATCARTARVC